LVVYNWSLGDHGLSNCVRNRSQQTHVEEIKAVPRENESLREMLWRTMSRKLLGRVSIEISRRLLGEIVLCERDEKGKMYCLEWFRNIYVVV
jgi:hypothetical protein